MSSAGCYFPWKKNNDLKLRGTPTLLSHPSGATLSFPLLTTCLVCVRSQGLLAVSYITEGSFEEDHTRQATGGGWKKT